MLNYSDAANLSSQLYFHWGLTTALNINRFTATGGKYKTSGYSLESSSTYENQCF